MRLSWQITLLVTVLLLFVLLTTIYISIHGNRQYLVEQMQIQAHDAGHSLSMSLIPILSAGETALAGAMVDSSFDRGHYQKIEIKDMQGNSIYKRQIPVIVQGVPDWFVSLTSLQNSPSQSPVVDGVTKIATLDITIHPANAYRALWKMTQANLKWITALGVIASVFIWLVVTYALRPLSRVKEQAVEISRQNYLLQKSLPFARELKQLVIAMNDMAEKLEAHISAQMEQVIELSNKVNTDFRTGILSRQGFDDCLNRILKEDAPRQGQLLILRISGLDRVNQLFSYKRGNEELKKLLTRIKEISLNEWEIGRLSCADIVILIPDPQGVELAQRCQQLTQALNDASEYLQGRIGAINISTDRDQEYLLKQANQALQTAMDVERGWYITE